MPRRSRRNKSAERKKRKRETPAAAGGEEVVVEEEEQPQQQEEEEPTSTSSLASSSVSSSSSSSSVSSSSSSFSSGSVSAVAATKDASLRILFLHGLESSLNGRKAAYLRAKYAHCECVDLQTSLWNFTRANCWVRHQVRNSRRLHVGAVVLAVAAAVLRFADVTLFNGSLLAVLLLVPTLFMMWDAWPEMVSAATHAMMEACLERTERAVRKFHPDVVVGSSFGGAVAVFSLLSQFYTGPTVLLCPAHAEVNRRMAFHWTGPHELPDETRIVIAHGSSDAIVSIEDSRQLARSDPRVRLHEIQGGHHRLRSLIGQGDVKCPVDLVSLIEEVVAM